MNDAPDLLLKPFDELTRLEIWEVFYLREVVFVVGQHITAEPEIDEIDPECWHALVRENSRLVATARVLERSSPIVVGRVAVHPDRQGAGLGGWLMTRIQEWLGDRGAELHAQDHLEAWYAGLGWERFGEPFVEADIPHVMMRWPSGKR